jgi:hypothetical protein
MDFAFIKRLWREPALFGGPRRLSRHLTYCVAYAAAGVKPYASASSGSLRASISANLTIT